MATAAVKTQRQISRRALAKMERQGAVLASAPVKPESLYPPILFTAEERDAATVRVWVEPLIVTEPEETWEQAGTRTGYTSRAGEFGNRGNDLAALRAQLRGNPDTTREVENVLPEWGDRQRVAVLLSMDGGRTAEKLILEGSWAAILRALPDPVTVQAWREAGATDFPVMLEPGQTTWVPIDQVPVVLQMEYETRGVVSNGSGN